MRTEKEIKKLLRNCESFEKDIQKAMKTIESLKTIPASQRLPMMLIVDLTSDELRSVMPFIIRILKWILEEPKASTRLKQ